MGIADAFRKNRQEQKDHTTPPPKGETVAEILQDRHKSDLFEKILEKGGRQDLKDLAARMARGKLEPGDIGLLEKQHQIYLETVSKAEKIEARLSAESIVDLARNHPEFAKVVKTFGAEKAANAIRSQLAEIAITDEPRFRKIASAMETMEKYKEGEYKKTNDETEKLLKEKGISQKDFLEALAIQDPDERATALKALTKKTYNGFWNFVSRGKFGKNKTIGMLEAQARGLELSDEELNKYQAAIGGVLFASLDGNDSLRNALSRELLDERTTQESKPGFEGAKQKFSGKFDEAKFKKDWESYKKKAGYDSHPGDQETIKDMFIDDQQKKYEQGGSGEGGLWYSIFSAIFGDKIKSKRSTLK